MKIYKVVHRFFPIMFSVFIFIVFITQLKKSSFYDIFFILSMFFILVGYSIFVFGYKFQIENGFLKEVIFGKAYRTVPISNILNVKLIRRGIEGKWSYGYVFTGNFTFNKNFPYLEIDKKLISEIKILNPNLNIDPYFEHPNKLRADI